ncbi:uncharacterized protein LOC143924890 [Lithobates pipiens]
MDKTNNIFGSLNSQFSSFSPGWKKFLWNGIWSQQIQNLKNTVDPSQWIPSSLQPFLVQVTPDMMACLQQQNVTCEIYQALVKNLNLAFPNMTDVKRQELYLALKSLLVNKQKVSGSACSQNTISSMWILLNLGKFSQFASIGDFTALNPNFTALEVLPLLTLQQIANFSVALNLTNNSAAIENIVTAVYDAGSVLDFLSYLNAAAMAKNISSLQPPLAQALLSTVFEALKANISSFNISDWTQLFQNTLSTILFEIKPNQLNLISVNLTCGSYQAIVAGLNSKFPQMTPETQKDVFINLIKPYMKNKGPACPKNGSSSALFNQNFGKFSVFADYSDFVSGLGDKFNALDVLPSLTTPQLANFALNTTMNAQIANSIVGALQNSTDIYNFLSSFNAALASNNQTSVDPALSKVLLPQIFQNMQRNFSSFNSSDWAQLFQDKLTAFLPYITPNQLNTLPKNLPCDSYQTILKGLDTSSPRMSTGTKQSIYNTFIKPYLTTKDTSNAIVCYNQTNANSSAWLVTNMASFLSSASDVDLMHFANDTMLQIFANDASCVALASTLKFSQSTSVYYTSLLTSNANFNLSSLPAVFLCSLKPSSLKNLTVDDSLALTNKINKQCFTTSPGQAPFNPTTEQLQMAMSLVSQLTNFSSNAITDLGQSAVGLSPLQIDKITDKDLQSSVSSLASVSGWNKGQTKSIMNKLLKSNYTITNLTNLGSLVSGLSSQNLLALDPKNVVNAVKDPQFASQLTSAPPALQNAFVKQIIAADSSPSSIVKNVPGNLVSFIPSSKLIYKSDTKPVLQDVNSSPWTPNQAAMFFNDLLTTTTNYTQISASVLQGFTCSTPSKIDNNQLKTLAKAMKTQNAALSEAQLTCLSRQVTKNGYPTDLDQYPTEVFLFLNSSMYINSINGSIGCKDFYAKIGAANVSILQKGSKLRNNLLTQALSCLNVTGSNLTDTNIQVLGQLTCDLNGTFIESSSGSGTLLSYLSQCNSFTDTQQTSIQKVLSSPNSTLGNSSTWTPDTLNSLGGIVAYLGQSSIGAIPTENFNSWMKTAVQNSAYSRAQFATLVKYRASSRSRRAANCPSGKQITASNVNDPLLPLNYNVVDLDACLDNDTLLNYLSILSSMAFTNEQLQVLKNRLDVIYPAGYPETVISNLGAISFLCTSADIMKWNITSVDTLGSLLTAGPPNSLAQIIITQYINLGNPLSGAAINTISSKYICLLNSTQLNLIAPTALSDAQPLDISICNQSVKDALYIKANSSYLDMANQASAYYNLIKPYLSGAPLADLKALAAKSPNMDISTFVSLNPNSVVKLTVSDVKSLLGNNTADLLTQLSSTTVSLWVQNQKQSDLDTLGLSILGGIRDVATIATTTTTTTKTNAASVFLQSLSFVLTAVGVTFLF